MPEPLLPITTEPQPRVPLPEIEVGFCARVAEVTADAEEIDRLKSMGVCVGRKVMLARAGDPLILRVLGSRIGVARRVLVERCGGGIFGEWDGESE